MRLLALGLAGLACDAALLAERVVIVCAAATTPPAVAAPAEITIADFGIDANHASCFDEALLEPIELTPDATPRELSAAGALYHATPAVFKPP